MLWFNGELRERGTIDASGAGLALGWGVFTTLSVREGRPRLLARHFARLERDARLAEVPFALDFPGVERALVAVLKSNRVANGLARLTLTRRGDGRWNNDEGADFSAMALETAPPAAELRVQLSPFRFESRRPLAGVKVTSYLPYLWAFRQAQAQGFDEAILRTERDFLGESARASLFWTRNGALYTPSLQTGCLDGIGRGIALEWAKATGIDLHEGEFEAGEAEIADEIWLVSAATGPRCVTGWHDEQGQERVCFARQGTLCGEFRAWFERIEE